MDEIFEFVLSTGQICRLTAYFEAKMEDEILYADGWDIIGDKKPVRSVKNHLTAYVDGKKFGKSSLESFWQLIDINGIPTIWGLRIGMTDPKTAADYQIWINQIIEDGKSMEVKAYEENQKEARIRCKIKEAKKTIAMANAQTDIPSKEEANQRMKNYNDAVNEGGFGYVPYIYSKEEYENAQKVLERYAEKIPLG